MILSLVRIFSVSGAVVIGGGLAAPVQAKEKTAAQIQECERKSAPYKKARAAYAKEASLYWGQVEKKKRIRRNKNRSKQEILVSDYVLKHPPVYNGPAMPECLKSKKTITKVKQTIGLVKDFLAAAKKIYSFTPKSVSEKEFKTAYATEALSAGLTAEQVVGVYALETGGLGPYSRQSGIFNVTKDCQRIKPKGNPASTALGYAQLLAANTAAVVYHNGEALAKVLEFRAVLSKGPRKDELLRKAGMLRRMVKDIGAGIKKYRNRDNWREFVEFGKTSKGFAIHALNLDVDIGPRVQVLKLKKITEVAESKGHKDISSAELELMNLVGFGRGLEMMRPVAQKAPTSNFFSRGGYERNPVAKNLTAAELLGRIRKIIEKQKNQCGSVEFSKVFEQVGKK